MKAKYKGPMSLKDFYQAFYQDHEFFEKHNIEFLQNATLYFTPCNEMGEAIEIKSSSGKVIEGFHSAGAYQSAADLYDKAAQIEPTTVIHPRIKPPSSGP